MKDEYDFSGGERGRFFKENAEFDLPSNSPSNRLDTEGAYNFSGALEISSGGNLYRGSAFGAGVKREHSGRGSSL